MTGAINRFEGDRSDLISPSVALYVRIVWVKMRAVGSRVIAFARALGICVLLSLAGCGKKPALEPTAGSFKVGGLEALVHKPILVLYDIDPWLMVMGSDVPRITIYEDGLSILFRPRPRAPAERLVAHLGRDDVAHLLERVRATGVDNIASYTDICHCSDGPTTTILYRTGAYWRSISMYGMTPEGLPTAMPSAPPPRAFVDARKLLADFSPTKTETWSPELIEVMLGAFEYSSMKPLAWPSDVPSPPAAAAAPDGVIPGVYKHRVAGIHEDKLRALERSLDPHQAVLVNGHKWSLGIKVLLPEEEYLHRVRDCANRAMFGEPIANCD
ncbi:MAG: hypothetical protein JWP87_564 [Labilithrix sp.]|nr:hypothetical protein [Labilithrix sp.]